MTSLRFHKDLYSQDAVFEAVGKFTGYAGIVCMDSGDSLEVTIEAARSDRELRIARELSNFALGLTIRSRPAR